MLVWSVKKLWLVLAAKDVAFPSPVNSESGKSIASVSKFLSDALSFLHTNMYDGESSWSVSRSLSTCHAERSTLPFYTSLELRVFAAVRKLFFRVL